MNVRNVAPTFTTPNMDGQMDEGSTYSLSGTVVDPGVLDTHTVSIDWGDSSTLTVVNLAAGAAFPTQTHKYVDNRPGDAPYTIHFIVTDSAGASIAYDLHEVVHNVAPTIRNLALSASSINEGDTVTLTGGWTDPGTLDTHSVTVQWGDGTSDTIPAPPNLYDASIQTFSIDHKYPNNPIGVIDLPLVVSVSDKNGGTGTAGQPNAPALAIHDVAPSVSVTVDQSAAAIDPTTLKVFATVRDPGFGDIFNPSGFNWQIEGIDATGASTVLIPFATGGTHQTYGPSLSFTYPTGVSYVKYIVSLVVTDRDGKTGTDHASVINLTGTSVEAVLTNSDFTTGSDGVTSGVILATGGGTIDASNVTIPLVIKGSSTDGSTGFNITGGQNNDLIIGDGATQIIDGGAGNDTIISNHGDDVIDVGSGNNTVMFVPGSSPTIIAPDDPNSVNTLDLSLVPSPDTMTGANAGVTLDLTKSGSGTPMMQMVDSTNSVSLQGTFRQVVGTSFDDTIVGSGLNDTLNGGGGSNSITAGTGNTTVYGGTGGKNTILAGNGNDLLFGGTGGGDSIVVGFANGPSRKAENAVLTDALLKLIDPSNGGTIVSYALANIQTAIVQGNDTVNLIDATAFSGRANLIGLGGNDSLIGGSGSDTLVGNSSTDLIEYNPGADVRLFDPSRNNVYLNAPPLGLQITVNTPGPFVEGSPISFSGSFVEYDDGDVNTFLWQVFAASDTTRSNPLFTSVQPGPSFTPGDNGSYVLVYSVSDNAGNTSTAETTLTVVDAPPVVTAPADQAGVLGSPLTVLLGSFSDAGLADSPWSVDVSWGDGTADSTFTTSAFSLGSVQHAFAQVGSRLVTVTVTDKDGISGSSTFHVSVAPALVLTNLAAGSPTVRNTPENYADVTFDHPIDTSTLGAADFTLTRNGSAVSIAGPLSVSDLGGNTYRVSGFASSTSADGAYVLSIDAAGVASPAGYAGVGVASASFTVDAKLVSSTVSVASSAPGIVFPITITGSDTDPATRVAGPGLDFFDIFWATDGSAFTFYATVPAGSPDGSGKYTVVANITGASNHTYAFYVRAHDLGGNVDTKSGLSEATTYVNDFTAPDTHVTSAVNNDSPTYQVSWSGADAPGGSGLKAVQLWVQVGTTVNGATSLAQPVLFQTVNVTTGQTSGGASYQVTQDGLLHTYRFYSVGIDQRNNTETAPNGPTDDVVSTYQTSSSPALAFTSLVVNGGLTNRSYIRTVDLGLTRSLTAAEFAAAHVTLIKHNLAGTDAGTAVDISTHVQAIDHAIEIEFGAAVLGGTNAVNNLSDGVYEIDLDLLGNNTVEKHYFYRLIGDTNNDLTVDQVDINAIAAALPYPTTSPNQDVNGDGRVNSTDKGLATRYKGSVVTFNKSLFK